MENGNKDISTLSERTIISILMQLPDNIFRSRIIRIDEDDHQTLKNNEQGAMTAFVHFHQSKLRNIFQYVSFANQHFINKSSNRKREFSYLAKSTMASSIINGFAKGFFWAFLPAILVAIHQTLAAPFKVVPEKTHTSYYSLQGIFQNTVNINPFQIFFSIWSLFLFIGAIKGFSRGLRGNRVVERELAEINCQISLFPHRQLSKSSHDENNLDINVCTELYRTIRSGCGE